MLLDRQTIMEQCRKYAPKRIAVAAAEDAAVLQSLADAYKLGLVQPIICGDIERIDATARLHNIDISPFEIIETDHDRQSISIAVSLVRSGRAELLMKGFVQTADLLRGVLDKDTGISAGGILSHVAAIFCPALSRFLLVTDGAMCMYPDLKTKIALIQNAVLVAHAMGIEHPKVAPLAAVEVVNPGMQATLDAAALVQMNRRGQITGCEVDGPLAFDVAVSEEAARHKGINSNVAGSADILLFPNIEAANATYKAITILAGGIAGGVVMGAQVPIVLTSRADSSESKVFSIALACLCASR